ncbi:hypothetical protein CAPTEDRAFT_126293, partial [Capitella teleta]
CNYPGRPLNGNFDGSFPATVGSVIIYSCEEGYSLNGTSEIVCEANGEWSGNSPSCDTFQCQKPSMIPNGSILSPRDVYYFGQSIMYNCNSGYTLVGPMIRTCTKINQKGAWSEFHPLCVSEFSNSPW